MKLLTLSSSFFLLASTALAADVTVTNNCPFSIYLKPDGQGFTAPINALAPKATYVAGLTGMGNAYKIARNPTVADPIQFDFSVNPSGPVYYDMSNIAGYPVELVATADGCNTVGCPGNCKRTEVCSADKSFTVKACP